MTLEDYVEGLYLAEVKHRVTSDLIESLEDAQEKISQDALEKYSINNFNRFSIKTREITSALDELKEFEYYESGNWDHFAKKVWENFNKEWMIVNKAAFLQFRDRWEAYWVDGAFDDDLEGGIAYEDVEEFFYEEVIPSGEADEALVSEVSLPKSTWAYLMETNKVDVYSIFEAIGNLHNITDYYREEVLSEVFNTLGLDEDEVTYTYGDYLSDLVYWENFELYIDHVDYVYGADMFTPTEVSDQAGQILDTLKRIQKDVPDINVKDSLLDEPPEIIYASQVEDADIAKLIEGKSLGLHTCLIASTIHGLAGEVSFSLGNISSEFAPYIDTVYLFPRSMSQYRLHWEGRCAEISFPKFRGQFTVLTSKESLTQISSALPQFKDILVRTCWSYSILEPSLYFHIDAGDNASLSIELYETCETFDLRVNSSKRLNVDFLRGSIDIKNTHPNISLCVDTNSKSLFSVADTYSTLGKNVTIYKGCSIPELIQYKTGYQTGKIKRTQEEWLYNLFPTQFEVVDETAIAYNKAFSKFGDVLWQNSRRETEFKVVYHATAGTPHASFTHLNNRGAKLSFPHQFYYVEAAKLDARGLYFTDCIIDSNDFKEMCAGATFYKCFFTDKVPEDTISVESLNEEVDLTIA